MEECLDYYSLERSKTMNQHEILNEIKGDDELMDQLLGFINDTQPAKAKLGKFTFEFINEDTTTDSSTFVDSIAARQIHFKLNGFDFVGEAEYSSWDYFDVESSDIIPVVAKTKTVTYFERLK